MWLQFHVDRTYPDTHACLAKTEIYMGEQVLGLVCQLNPDVTVFCAVLDRCRSLCIRRNMRGPNTLAMVQETDLAVETRERHRAQHFVGW